MWKDVKCNICGSTDVSKRFEINKQKSFNIVKCRLCGLVFMNPQFIDKKMYQNYYTAGWSNRDDRGVAKSKWIIYRDRLKHMKKFVSGKKLLDVGCAFGSFIGYAKENNWDASGTEVSKKASDYCKSMGIKAYCGELEKLKLPKNYFDVITMFDVIEHLPDPSSTIKICYKLLKKGGILVIETGNVDSIYAKLMGKKWEYYGLPHLHYFSSTTIKKLLGMCGFKKIKIYYGDEIPLSSKIKRVIERRRRDKISYKKMIKTVLSEILREIHISNLSVGGMVVYAQK